MTFGKVAFLLISSLLLSGLLPAQSGAIGQFAGHRDVGVTPLAGSAEYDAVAGTYRVTGGGANMWGSTDAFHFVWKQVSGDVTLTTDVAFEGTGKNAHRKAGVLVRQSLDGAGSAYADAVVHGDGLTSLQFRQAQGGPTNTLEAMDKAPRRIRLTRRGDDFTLFISTDGGDTFKAVGSAKVPLGNPVYVGLVVCSHDESVTETAVFSRVEVR